MSRRKAWVAPNVYIQFLHDNALIGISLYYEYFPNNKEADWQTFWDEDIVVYFN